MPFRGWIKRLQSKSDLRRRHRAREAQRVLRNQLHAQLTLARLEDRRVLNADFSLAGGPFEPASFDVGSGGSQASAEPLISSTATDAMASVGAVAGSTDTPLTKAGSVSYWGTAGNDAIELLQTAESGVAVIEVRLDGELQVQWAAADVSEITIYGGDGDDTLTVNYGSSDAFLGQLVTFHGGDQLTETGDELVLTGGPFESVTHTLINSHDGSVAIDGTTRIVYTGLEPVTDNANTADRVFTFTGGGETITLTDRPGENMRIDSTLSESVDFPTPSNSLTIDAGTGNDAVTISSVDGGFGGSLTIDGGDGTDSVTFNTDITFSTGQSLSVDADGPVTFGVNTDLITSGVGTASVTGGSVTLGNNASLVSADSVVLTTDAVSLSATNASINAGTGSVTIKPMTAGTAINLGGVDAPGTLGLTDGELDRVTAGTLYLGDSSSGAITITADITRPAAADVYLTSGGEINFSGGSFDTNGGNLTLSPDNTGSVGVPRSGVDVSVGANGILAFASGSDLSIVINGTTVDTQYSQLSVAGQVNLTDVDLVLSGVHTPVVGESFVIVNNDGIDPIIGALNGLPQDATILNFLGSGLSAQISYTGGTGNDVVIVVGVPTYDFSAPTFSVAEGHTTATTAIVTVTRSGRTFTASSVDVVLSSGAMNGATPGSDFTAGPITVHFLPGETSKIVPIEILGETIVEANETIDLAFTNFSHSGQAGTMTPTATLTLINDDIDLTIAADVAVQDEGHAGTTAFTFTVTRTGALDGTTTADYAVGGLGGSPADGADFGGSLPSGIVTFTAGQTSRTITVQVTGDRDVESDEAFRVTLRNAADTVAAHAVDIAQATADGQIINDDIDFIDLAIVAASAVQDEGRTGTTAFTFVVSRTGATDGTTAVDYTVTGLGGSAADADDFGGGLPYGTVTFTAGETSREISVLVTGDRIVEADEGFRVTLSNSADTSGNVVQIVTAEADGQILNDDQTTLTIVSIHQNEGSGGETTAFGFVVTLSNPVQGGLSVQAQTADGTAVDGTAATTANNDYQNKGQTLFFAGDEGEQQTITVLVNHDYRYELDEQFTVTLRDASALGVGVLSSNVTILDSPATGTIANEDTDIIETGTGLDDTMIVKATGTDSGTFQITTDGVAGPVIPFSGVTSLTFSGLDGDDVLIIEHPAVTYFSPSGRVSFDGGPQIDSNSEGLAGDLLVIYSPSNETADKVVHSLAPVTISANGFDGSIEITDASTGVMTSINYTGVEPVIDHLTAIGRSFEFNAESEIVTLRDDPAVNDGNSRINSDLAVTLTFLNPSNSLSIVTATGSGADAIHIEGLDSQFDADLCIIGDGDSGEQDTVTFQTNATNLGSGSLRIDSGGAVSQTTPIAGTGLQLIGAGPFRLTNEGNAFATLAADTTGTIEYTDSDGLDVGTVEVLGYTVPGIISGGQDVAIQTGADLTVNQPVNLGVGDLTLKIGGVIQQDGDPVVDVIAAKLTAEAIGGIDLDTRVASLAGVANSGGGDVDLENDGTVTVSGSVTNNGGGDTTLTANGGTLTIAAPVTNDVAGNVGGGSITLAADGHVVIQKNVTTNGGQRDGADANQGMILIDAGEQIRLDPGVTIATGTGQMTAAPPPEDMPPPVDVRLVPVDQGGSNVNSMGRAIVEVTVGDVGENYQITIDWSNGVATYPPGTSVDGQARFEGGPPSPTYRFDRYYTSNPDPTNASAPIPVTVTIAYDGRSQANLPLNGIVFKEGGQVLSTTVSDVLTVPGTGLFAFIKVVESEIVPVALRQETGTVPIASQTVSGSQQTSSYEAPAAELEFAAHTGLQLFFRRVDAAGQEGEDVALPPELLERGLFEVFQRFPNGRYRIYLKEPNSDRERLIQELHIYQGRIVPPDFRDDASQRQMGDESEKPIEQRPASEAEAEGGGEGAQNTPAAKPAAPQAEDGPAAGESVQPADSASAVGGAAIALGMTGNGISRQWAERVDRAFQAGTRSLSKAARLTRSLQLRNTKD